MNKALCIGINDYPGTNSDLAGCVNDANDWAKLLDARGFSVETCLDADATKATIMDGLEELVEKTGYGETGLIQYSGHGTWIPDLDRDELDKRDEAWCPHDIADGQLIVDDELAAVLSAKRYGARILLISDSCHSGSVQRLVGPIGGARCKVKFLAPEIFLDGKDLKRAELMPPTARTSSRARLRANMSLLLAGCRDHEYSYDAWFDRRANGAFTYVAIKMLDSLAPGGSYEDWIRRIRTMLPSQDYPQTPQLSGRAYRRLWEALA